MVRFADGDRGAFREVFDGLWPMSLALATRSLMQRADAEDVAQRAILKVFDRIVDLDRERDGVAWAMTITAFEVLTMRKQISARPRRCLRTVLNSGSACGVRRGLAAARYHDGHHAAAVGDTGRCSQMAARVRAMS
jgi:DNA-directed RNA polymerase specialized sigma24 family protein